MNTAKKRQYFSLCPSMDETKYIYLEYEDYRKRMVSDGIKPSSLSRYLINIILQHYRDANEGISNG